MPTANEVKESVKNYLNTIGHFAWRQNNLAVRGRAFVGKKGVPDVMCILKHSGRFAGFEVKVGKDTPSPEQLKFQKETESRGAYYFFVSSLDEVIRIFEKTKQLE